MTARRAASRLLLGAGLLLLVAALGLLLSSWLLPARGLEDLGRVVGAMLAAGLAGVAFALGLLAAPPGSLPRWQVALAALGCVPALVAGSAFASTGTPGPAAFGLALAVLAVVGLLAAWRLARAAPQRAL